MSMFGQILWQAPDYIEYLLADEKNTRLVVGIDPTTELHGTIKLFRIEWSEPDGYQRNKVVYHLLDAIQTFQEIANEQPEQEQPFDWQAIEAQAKIDLEAIQTDQDAYAFIEKYLSKELRHQYIKIYRSDRHEMLRTPKKAIENLLSLPPL